MRYQYPQGGMFGRSNNHQFGMPSPLKDMKGDHEMHAPQYIDYYGQGLTIPDKNAATGYFNPNTSPMIGNAFMNGKHPFDSSLLDIFHEEESTKNYSNLSNIGRNGFQLQSSQNLMTQLPQKSPINMLSMIGNNHIPDSPFHGPAVGFQLNHHFSHHHSDIAPPQKEL